MTSPTPRNVLSLDTPDSPDGALTAMREPSAELLDRALAGFERLSATAPAQSDE
ncbi:hypothetical protein ACFWP3_10310 [Streptomyces sp. NPDC058525]|uniref:hypothetical protein n=1 Tax=Streptomyces sp. NPDC058525 TaxID=3346538 RepID=UPI00366092D1